MVILLASALTLTGCVSAPRGGGDRPLEAPGEGAPTRDERPEVAACRERGLALLERYSPSCHRLLRYWYDLPKKYAIGGHVSNHRPTNDPFFVFANVPDELFVVCLLPVVVHESNHALQGTLGAYLYTTGGHASASGWGRGYVGYYFGDSSAVAVPITRTFPSREMGPSIPRALYDTPVSRCPPYVLERDYEGGSTQQKGVYGLLDEFHAYYWTAVADLELLSYFRSGRKPDSDAVFRLCARADDWYHAYLEFKYFILHYVLFARTHDPDVHRTVMESIPFLQAFILTDRAYADICRRLYEGVEDLIETTFPEATRTQSDDVAAYEVWIDHNHMCRFELRNEARWKHRPLEAAMEDTEYIQLYEAMSDRAQ